MVSQKPKMHLLGDVPSSFHTYILETTATDHNFPEPKLDAPESNAFPPRTIHFQTKIEILDEDPFRVVL